MQQPSEGGGTGSELASDAKQLSNSAADRIHSEVNARKSGAAEQARSVSTAIQHAAGDLDQNAPSWLKSAFQQGAQQVQRFADALENKDSRELVNEVQDFARDRPALFLSACAAAGFAAARIFKAGGEQQGGGSEGQHSARHQFGGEGTQQFGGGTEASGQRTGNDAHSTSVPSYGESAR